MTRLRPPEPIKNKKEKSRSQKKALPIKSPSKGIEIHSFNEKNVMQFFFQKTNNKAKKYELYWFFFNREDLKLNNKIDALINKWHKQGILNRNSNNWYSPNLQKKDDISKILKGDSN